MILIYVFIFTYICIHTPPYIIYKNKKSTKFREIKSKAEVEWNDGLLLGKPDVAISVNLL